MSKSFEALGIDEDYNSFFKEEAISEPNQVQLQVIKAFMTKKSVVCLAQTGSGKTLSYVLPATELMKRDEDIDGVCQKLSMPKIVVIAPTKELAFQIEKVFKKLSHHVAFRTRSLVGGQKRDLKTQAYEVLIATPQSLAKALKNKTVNFELIKDLVFDEADNLFEMGFKKDIDTILRNVEFSQTRVHFFSATLGELAKNYIEEKFSKLKPVWININANKVQRKVETYNIYLSPKEKKNMLKAFFDKNLKGRGIVFVNQKNQLLELDEFLKESKSKVKYRVLYGDMPAKERTLAHKSFIDGKSQVLIATDIMARGIDIKDLSWVLNYGLPKTAIYYLHRSGRVGRANKTGVVYNFITNFDSKLIGFINEAIRSQSTLDIDQIKVATEKVQKVSTPKASKKEPKSKQTKRDLRYGDSKANKTNRSKKMNGTTRRKKVITKSHNKKRFKR